VEALQHGTKYSYRPSRARSRRNGTKYSYVYLGLDVVGATAPFCTQSRSAVPPLAQWGIGLHCVWGPDSWLNPKPLLLRAQLGREIVAATADEGGTSFGIV